MPEAQLPEGSCGSRRVDVRCADASSLLKPFSIYIHEWTTSSRYGNKNPKERMMLPLLNGIRIIEIGAVVLGPYAGQMLDDLGAEGIKGIGRAECRGRGGEDV